MFNKVLKRKNRALAHQNRITIAQADAYTRFYVQTMEFVRTSDFADRFPGEAAAIAAIEDRLEAELRGISHFHQLLD